MGKLGLWSHLCILSERQVLVLLSRLLKRPTGNKCIDQKLRAARVAGWCCLSAPVGFLVLCRAATPGSPVSSWQSFLFQGGWNRADWRFRGHRALGRHRLERVKELIRSRGKRRLNNASRLLPAKFCLEIFANSKSTQTKMSLLLPHLF